MKMTATLCLLGCLIFAGCGHNGDTASTPGATPTAVVVDDQYVLPSCSEANASYQSRISTTEELNKEVRRLEEQTKKEIEEVHKTESDRENGIISNEEARIRLERSKSKIVRIQDRLNALDALNTCMGNS
jgi:hypothetical protein